MRHLLSARGEAALAALMRRRPLLAFDFDGTLAPIVARPEDARVPAAVAARLAVLALRLPVAIVTGRAIGDVRHRLGFEPQSAAMFGLDSEAELVTVLARIAAPLPPPR